MIHELSTPVEFGGAIIRTIELREVVKVKDLKGIDLVGGSVSFDDLMTLVGRLSGHPDLLIGELPFEDASHLAEAAAGFLAGKGGNTTAENGGKSPSL